MLPTRNVKQSALALVFMTSSCFATAQHDVKPLRLDTSAGSEKNSEGIRLAVTGRLKDAAAAFDHASLQDMSTPIPWVNGAWVQLELGNKAQAFRANREAMLMGDRSLRRVTLNIEIETARGQLAKAWKSVEAAEFQQPEEPYVHLARAKWADAAAQSRVAERSRWQAFRMGRNVVLDSKLFTAAAADVGGGSVDAGRLDGHWRFTGPLAGQVEGRLQAETLGGMARAKNRLGYLNLAVDTQVGIFMGGYRTLASDRPGPQNFNVPTPAHLRYADWMLGWQHRLGPFTFNLNLRQADADLKANATAPLVRNVFQSQWMAEARFDRGPWTLGGGLSEVYRNSVANPAIEPFEDVFSNGRTRLSHAYIVHRLDLSKSARLISGAVLEHVGNRSHGLFTAELAVKLFGDRYVRIGVKPTMNRAGTVIFPEDLRARPLGSNPIDRVFNSTLSTNRATNLFPVTGKSLDAYLTVPLSSSSMGSVSATAFQKQFRRALFLVGDPQQDRMLNLLPVDSGKITGLTLDGTWTPTSFVELGAFATVQNSRASRYTAGSESRVPNTPSLLAGITADVALGNWSIALAANYVGPRAQAMTDMGVAISRPRSVGPTWGFDLHVSHPFAGGSLNLSALNLTRSSFFRGYDSSPSFLLSYSSRF